MVREGLVLSPHCFNAVVSGHAKAGRADRASSVVDLMRSCSGIKPTLVTYNSLALAYAAYGDIWATDRVLSQAMSEGHALDGYSYGAVLQACAKHADKRQ